MTLTDTANRIRALLAKDFNLAPDQLTLDVRLEDLGVDSIGMAELIFSIEDEFLLKLPDVAVQLSTFGEVVQYIDDALAARLGTAAVSSLMGGAQTAT